MATEGDFWQLVKRRLGPYGHLQRIESPGTRLGIPDVNYCLARKEGWFELKYLPGWPGPRSPIKFRHYTIEQVEWAAQRHRAGGRAGLMAQIGREFFFFDPPAMRAIYNGVRKPVFEAMALVQGRGEYPVIPMLKALGREI